MSVYWSAKTRNLQPYVPGEQPAKQSFGAVKLIKLNTNENPYPPSPLVIEAIEKAAVETLRLYPDPASTELREAIAQRYGLKASEVFPGNGSDEVLAFVFPAFFESGAQSIHFPDITYSFYPVYANLWDIPFTTIPLEDDFSINAAVYSRLMSEGKSGGIIFPNPNAPTGILLSVEEIRKIAEAAKQNKKVLVVDEAYIAFAEEDGGKAGAGVSAVTLLNEFPNLLIVRTLSKEASLAGLRAGFALGSEELIEGLCRVKDSFNSYPMDRLAQAGAAAVMKDYSYYDDINRRIIATRRRVSSGLESMGFRVLPSQANFLFASPPSGSGKSAAEIFSALRERGIIVRHFNKPRIADYLRISIGTDEEMDIFLNECERIFNF